MFGIEDPGIYMAYLLGIACIAFSLWFGITHWNKEDDNDSTNPKDPEQ